MISMVLVNITAAVPMSNAVRDMVVAAINAGATATAIIALLGGGGLIAFIVRQAFKKGVTKLIIAA